MLCMARNYKPGPGRPSKGPRKAFATRLAVPLAEAVEAEASSREMTYSEYLAALADLMHRDGELLPEFAALLPPRKKPTSVQATTDDYLDGLGMSKSA